MKFFLIAIFITSFAVAQYDYAIVTIYQKLNKLEFVITTEIDTLKQSFDGEFPPVGVLKNREPQKEQLKVFNFMGARGFRYIEFFEAIQKTSLMTELTYIFERKLGEISNNN